MTEGTRQDPNGDAPRSGDARLHELDARLKAAAAPAGRSAPPRRPDGGYAQGMKVLTELVAGLAGGGLAGFLLDRWLGTSPWALLVLLFLGFAVAMRNIYRISQSRPG